MPAAPFSHPSLPHPPSPALSHILSQSLKPHRYKLRVQRGSAGPSLSDAGCLHREGREARAAEWGSSGPEARWPPQGPLEKGPNNKENRHEVLRGHLQQHSAQNTLGALTAQNCSSSAPKINACLGPLVATATKIYEPG